MAAFVAEHGEAGVRSIDTAAGNLANAKLALPQVEAELAAEAKATAAAEAKAAEAAAAKSAADAEDNAAATTKAAAGKTAAEDAAKVKAAAEKKAAAAAAKAKAAADKKAAEVAAKAKAAADKKAVADAKAKAAVDKKAAGVAAKAKEAAEKAAADAKARAENVSGMTEDEFIAEYRRGNPYTRYNKKQLKELYGESRYVIHPRSKLLNDVNAGKFGPPQDRADYVRDTTNQPVTDHIPRDQLNPDVETKARALAAERQERLTAAKQSRGRSATSVKDESEAAKELRLEMESRIENEALQQARLASKELGEDAAEEFGKRFEGGGRAKHKGRGAGDFDFSYTGAAADDAVVLEAKGGESGLGTRYAIDGETRVEQGTRAYAEAVIEDIRPRDPVRAASLSKALKTGKLKYYVVRQTVDATGALGPIQIQEFKL